MIIYHNTYDRNDFTTGLLTKSENQYSKFWMQNFMMITLFTLYDRNDFTNICLPNLKINCKMFCSSDDV